MPRDTIWVVFKTTITSAVLFENVQRELNFKVFFLLLLLFFSWTENIIWAKKKRRRISSDQRFSTVFCWSGNPQDSKLQSYKDEERSVVKKVEGYFS
jgi:hypothetical protein